MTVDAYAKMSMLTSRVLHASVNSALLVNLITKSHTSIVETLLLVMYTSFNFDACSVDRVAMLRS